MEIIGYPINIFCVCTHLWIVEQREQAHIEPKIHSLDKVLI